MRSQLSGIQFGVAWVDMIGPGRAAAPDYLLQGIVGMNIRYLCTVLVGSLPL